MLRSSMLNMNQNLEEEFQMLLITLKDVKSGICIFQSQNQTEWVARIQQALKDKKISVHDIANDEIKEEMITSEDFRNWASDSDAQIVIVYNMQLLGIRYGDEEIVEKLNFMRDQIQEIGKVFLFGMTPFFSLLLSRKAVDLYSCVLHNFRFRETLNGNNELMNTDVNKDSGNVILNYEKYWEYRKRIEEGQYKIENHVCIEFLECWTSIRDYLNNRESIFIECQTANYNRV